MIIRDTYESPNMSTDTNDRASASECLDAACVAGER